MNIYVKKVNEIMSEYKPLYPEPYTWDNTFAYLMNSTADKEIVNLLIEELHNNSHNLFKEPINLSEEIYTKDELMNEDNDNISDIYLLCNDHGNYIRKYVGDGTHRLCAAYIAGIEEILVKSNEELEYENTPYIICTKVKNSDKTTVPFSDEENDMIADHTRSLKLSKDLWIVQSVSSEYKNTFSIIWDRYHPDIDLQEITNIILDKLHKILPHIEFSVETFLECWDKEDPEDEKMWSQAEKE